jgi:putative ABC transport system permease protein
MSIVARTTTDPMAAATPVQNAVWAVDPDQAIHRLRSMEEVIHRDIGVWGVVAALLSVFAGAALVLAAVGLYGVMSYSVSRRTQEIGIRMALGARPADVLRVVGRRSVVLTLIGVAGGIVLALGLGRVLASVMYGVSATDPVTYVGVTVLMCAVGFAAMYIPARRATKVDPMVALRYE